MHEYPMKEGKNLIFFRAIIFDKSLLGRSCVNSMLIMKLVLKSFHIQPTGQ